MSNLELIPISLKDANEFVSQHHRHSSPLVNQMHFAVAAGYEDRVVGVAIVGLPVARALNDEWTAEVRRVATDGTRNACSMLYGAAWRAARALGYRRLVTYTLASESGSSLKASGWTVVAELPARGPKGWNTPSRPRVEVAGQERLRWELST